METSLAREKASSEQDRDKMRKAEEQSIQLQSALLEIEKSKAISEKEARQEREMKERLAKEMRRLATQEGENPDEEGLQIRLMLGINST